MSTKDVASIKPLADRVVVLPVEEDELAEPGVPSNGLPLKIRCTTFK